MPNTKYLKQTDGISSAQAAALYLTDGRTDDAKLVNHARDIDNAVGEHGFYFDALDKDHLVKTIGFPFEVVIKHKKLTVFARDKPQVTKTVKFSGIENEQMVEKLVALCLDVKQLYEESK
jgi:hypothetical protein